MYTVFAETPKKTMIKEENKCDECGKAMKTPGTYVPQSGVVLCNECLKRKMQSNTKDFS